MAVLGDKVLGDKENHGAWATPLREVERAAQERAKAADLDMSRPDARDRLREMVLEEVAAWRDQFRKGHRPVDIADPDGAVERALRNLAGYGPLEALLADPDVWEIMIWGERPDQFRESPGEPCDLLTAHVRR